MRPNASGTTRANTSLTIGSLNDRKIFVTRSSAGSITCGTIHKRSKAYFVLFFNSHVELLMRAYIALAIGRILGSALYLVPHEHSGMLYGVKIYDPLSMVVASVVLLAVLFLASFLPARRAMRVDPMVTLRYE